MSYFTPELHAEGAHMIYRVRSQRFTPNSYFFILFAKEMGGLADGLPISWRYRLAGHR